MNEVQTIVVSAFGLTIIMIAGSVGLYFLAGVEVPSLILAGLIGLGTFYLTIWRRRRKAERRRTMILRRHAPK
jgi:ABC-type Fe3+-siderophore transport system permease subunit